MYMDVIYHIDILFFGVHIRVFSSLYIIYILYFNISCTLDLLFSQVNTVYIVSSYMKKVGIGIVIPWSDVRCWMVCLSY